MHKILGGWKKMPRAGYTSITIPNELKKRLEGFCKERGFKSMGRCISFLLEFYYSVMKDPYLETDYKTKKIQRASKRAQKRYDTYLEKAREEATSNGGILEMSVWEASD